MTGIRKRVDQAVPFWAAFSAPLVGALIMVVMFALAPEPAARAGEEGEVGIAAEEVEPLDAEAAGIGERFGR